MKSESPSLDQLLTRVKMRPIDTISSTDDTPHPTHEGWHNFGPFSLRAYRLSNGSRVWDAEDLAKLMGETIS